MGRKMLVLLAGVLAMSPAFAGETLLDRDFRKLAGKETVNLAQAYGGQVLLVVNTASKCGFTPQYEGLEAMYAKYKDQGFAVLGFPSNDFMGQEPGSEEDIQEFCTLTYGVKFPMFEKVQVRGADATPLYRDLAAATGEAPGWNFHKYLIDREGKVVASFGSRTKPEDPKLVAEIEKLLDQPAPAAKAAKAG
ncbi:glutathione peroxidase [Arenimonas sp.]|uniref:glutathione peroxidase n=1 Tax=Arenimonas sp. TaxID=1872635 RepID=UPI0035B1E000